MNQQAVDEYLNQVARAAESAKRISVYLKDHGEISPDNVNWGNASYMEHIANRLTELQAMIDKTGEYAQ